MTYIIRQGGKNVSVYVRKALDKIYQKHGILSEEIVVDESRNPENPLHPLFFWDDDKRAARIGRLEIARRLIVRVKITKAEAKKIGCNVTIRRYHGRVNGGYRDIDEIVTEETLYAGLLRAALRDARAFRDKYRTLAELESLFTAIDEVLDEHDPANSGPAMLGEAKQGEAIAGNAGESRHGLARTG